MEVRKEDVRDLERILLSGWLNGYHEDVKDFETWEFLNYSNILNAIKKYGYGKVTSPERSKDLMSLSARANVPIANILELTSETPTESMYYTAYLTHKTYTRNRIFKNRNMDVDEWKKEIERLSTQIDNIDSKTNKEKDIAMDFLEDLSKRRKEKPIYFGIQELDRFLNGLRNGELTTIAARPAVGKSALALQIAEFVARRGKRTAFFALEMDINSLVMRLIAKNSKVPFEAMQNPNEKMTEDNYREIVMQLDDIDKLQRTLDLNDDVRSLENIERKIKLEKPEVVFIDQLSLIRSTRYRENSIRERFSYITVNLKRMAMENNIPIVLMAQLRRSMGNAVPDMNELKESGSIEEDSDNIILIHAIDQDKAVEMGEFVTLLPNERAIEFIVEKQRNGTTGSTYAKYRGEKFTFESIY